MGQDVLPAKQQGLPLRRILYFEHRQHAEKFGQSRKTAPESCRQLHRER
jgi:hypothetical protein